MGACSNCGGSIQKSSLFCGTCGAKVPAAGLPTSPQASIKIQDHVDPLASTAPASRSPAAGLLKRAAEGVPPESEAKISPRAETVARPASEPPPAAERSSQGARSSHRGKTVPLSALANPPATSRPSSGNPPKAAAPSVANPPAASGSPAPFSPGARVLVQWANGQRYPGVIDRVNGPQCLVRFDVGEQRWVESRFVLPAK